MAKAKSGGHRPAGGIGSNKSVEKPVKTGQRARAVSPRGVSQIGSSIGNHSTDRAGKLTKGVEPVHGPKKPAGGPGGIELGNQCALNVGGGGPGTGRTLYGQCGTQGHNDGELHPIKKGPGY
jgi:hypothetical protein